MRETSLELSRLGYHLILTTDEPHNSVIDTYRVFTDKRLVDGFVVLDLKNEDERVDFLKLRNIPFVAVGRNEKDKDISFVDTDNEGGAYLAGKHLARKGSRMFSLLTAQPIKAFLYGGNAAFKSGAGNEFHLSRPQWRLR